MNQVVLVPVFPLAGAAILLLFGKRLRSIAGVLATVLVAASFGVAVSVLLDLAKRAGDDRVVVHEAYRWVVTDGFRVSVAFRIDPLSVVMLLVVTGVGALIHWYAIGYMAHDERRGRFFAYLNLFVFSMLILVLAGNFLLMYVGWELVGLCSYLLISFWFFRPSAAAAGKKAFIVTRIGDLGMFIGIFAISKVFGSLDFGTVFGAASRSPAPHFWATAIPLLLFAGAVGKSAQIPLYVWLPDAMEGPTPVSALIHAATMVTAGVYLVARAHVLFEASHVAGVMVTGIGAATLVYAATMALTEDDIKRVLAYSTVSQLGYMFLGCGVAAFSAGIFHLMTHAFFKGLLFLAAGSVIHAMGGEQDMRRMGGLRKQIPWTYWTMLLATLSISGAPLFAGFFSKDKILFETAVSLYGGRVLWSIALVAALLTAFYMFRLIFLTFHGAPRYDAHATHVHESPKNMLAPLVVLAVLSVVGGWVAAPALAGGADYFEIYLAPVFAKSSALLATAGGETESRTLELQLMGVAVGLATLGFLVAWWFYIRRPQTPEWLAETFHAPYKLLLNKYYVDELYNLAIIRPIGWISTRLLWQVVDEGAIDGSVNGVAHTARRLGSRLRVLASGNTRSYAAWVLVGAVLLLGLLLWPLLGMVR